MHAPIVWVGYLARHHARDKIDVIREIDPSSSFGMTTDELRRGQAVETSPDSKAMTTSCVRSRAPSLERVRLTCVLTVGRLT
jgi:hypothetical protein